MKPSRDAWMEFNHTDRYEQDAPVCYHCGCACSGDVTQTVEIVDGHTAEVAICDDPETCPAN